MSKNVAVFVDVANIFYAAKAAGVDIDYVTLLKSSVAGRDFVRAYAYTGLDPDNENQRQFHSFLARNGYKVVSKDIRKYGDGRIKANLDIELVVDLMRMARNLDIAVVVSGDGDFAPAIRAVQQMGVRVEVVSFRGNTSSDLIEVADAFTDIAQIARVEKGSARSGRRVAAEGDLSMTEVPEKETEGAPRRRRGRGRAADGADAAEPTDGASQPAAEAEAIPANMIVLPGERLARAPEDGATDDGPEDAVTDEPAADEALGESGSDADGRRRRRRRGGRGRGRGRRDTEGVVAEGETPEPEDEEEDFEPVAPAQLPHQTFGSVWDTQLGVPAAPMTLTGEVFTADEEDYDDEPEVPEYLLAERRQRGQQRGQRGGRMGGRGRAAGYQAAVERERYGRGGAFGGPRMPDRPRPDRPRQGQGRPQQRPQRQEQRPPREREQRSPERQPQASGSGQPWSEVPPEVEELLRAELARRPGRAAAPSAEAAAPAAGEDQGNGQPQAAAAAGAQAEPVAEAAGEAVPKRRTTRRKPTAADEPQAEQPVADATGEEAPAEPPKRRTTRRTMSASASTDAGDQPAADASGDEPAAKPKRAPRTRKAAATAEASPDSAGAEVAGDEQPAEKKPVRRRRTKAADAPSEAGPEG